MNSFEQNEERIKADVNAVIQSVSNGQQPDMERLKEAGSDILSTASSFLSNSGIDGLTGSGGAAGAGGGSGLLGNAAAPAGAGDGAAEAAGGILKKLRDGLGLDGNALDGLRRAADELKNKL
jgi:hypothetical protein